MTLGTKGISCCAKKKPASTLIVILRKGLNEILSCLGRRHVVGSSSMQKKNKQSISSFEKEEEGQGEGNSRLAISPVLLKGFNWMRELVSRIALILKTYIRACATIG